MSQENVEVVLQGFAAFARGDYEDVLRAFDEHVVITQPAELLDAPSLRQYGHDGVLEALALWPEQWDDYRIESIRVLAHPADHVVISTRQSGRGRQSGIEVEMEFSFLFTLRHGKVTEWRMFLDEAEALEAAGLPE